VTKDKTVRDIDSTREECLQMQFKELQSLYREGRPPGLPLEGRYRGRLLALRVFPGVTQAARLVTRLYMPWMGKGFDPASGAGYNIFSRSALLPSRLFWPMYRGYKDDGASSFRSFYFKTWRGPGLMDPEVEVLKIEYAGMGNPRFTISRVLDEVVETQEGRLLGKAHLRWWFGGWQTVAFFELGEWEG
jgi:hypothetical protein